MSTDFIALAVDPGTTTGWACSDGRSGYHRLAHTGDTRLSQSARHGARARRFRDWLDAELSRSGAAVLVLERQQGGRGGGDVTLGLRMIALEMAVRRRVLVEEPWPAAWQAWARRNGWAKRKSGDEDDARALLAWWLEHRGALISVDKR